VDIFDTFEKANNFWFSEVFSDRVEHTAYGVDGRVLDRFTQYTSSYKL